MTHTFERHGAHRDRRWRTAAWLAAAALLTVPLVAMRLTAEVNWTASDFMLAGVLLFGSLGAFELATRRSTDIAYRAGIALTLLGVFLLVWINAAVGIIGSEGDPANLMFAGVLVIGAIGTLIARLHARGMARALVGTALAQLLVGGIALGGLAGPIDGSGQVIVVLTLAFVALWAAAAALFATAAP